MSCELQLQGLSYGYLSSRFAYDPLTGVVSRLDYRAGPVGSTDSKGYLHVSVQYRFIRLHRLAWFLHYRVVPPRLIDHRNRDRKDNRISNLRECDDKGNAGNSGIPANNTSGLRGVSWSKHTSRWHAQIKLNGKQTFLGGFASKEDAARCYDHAAIKHFGEFASVNYPA